MTCQFKICVYAFLLEMRVACTSSWSKPNTAIWRASYIEGGAVSVPQYCFAMQTTVYRALHVTSHQQRLSCYHTFASRSDRQRCIYRLFEQWVALCN